MAKFKDNAGREWVVDVNIATLKSVNTELGVDLLDASSNDGEILKRLYFDPMFLADVLFVVCRDQAGRAEVSDEDFGRGLAGDAIDDGHRALLDSLQSFFRNPNQRQAFAKALERMDTLEAKLHAASLEMLSDEQIDQAIERELRKAGEEFTARLAS